MCEEMNEDLDELHETSAKINATYDNVESVNPRDAYMMALANIRVGIIRIILSLPEERAEVAIIAIIRGAVLEGVIQRSKRA